MMTQTRAQTIVDGGFRPLTPRNGRPLEMSTKLVIVGAVSALCLSVGLAEAETPAASPQTPAGDEVPADANAAAAGPERWRGPESAPMLPGPLDWEPMSQGPTDERPMRHGPMPWGPMRQGAPGGPAAADEREQEWLTRVLGLSTEQGTALGKLLEEQRSRADALRGPLREAGRKLAAALADANPVPATVGALLIEQRALIQKLEASHGQADQALRALLTSEQQATLDSLQKSWWRGRREWGRGAMRFGGGPMGRPPGMPPAPPPPPGPDEPAADDVQP
jgi:Spy/CpxP family protein refolding chaperone